MKELIADLKGRLIEYTKLVSSTDVDNLNYEDTESYGVYLGKKELLEELIPKLEKLN
jgi:hypothetical protein